MAQYSPELIEQTISIFKHRSGAVLSHEDARQAVENIIGFFRILQEWAEAEDGDDSSEALPAVPGMGARTAQ